MATASTDWPKVLIFWRSRLVVLATPRCASHAIQSALVEDADAALAAPWALNHLSAMRYRRHVAPLLQDLGLDRVRVVGLVREPVSWIGSWYRSQLPTWQSAENDAPSFNSFVDLYLKPGSEIAADIGDQSRYLQVCREPVVTDLFAFEDLSGFCQLLEGLLGRRIRLQRTNVAPDADLTLSPVLEKRLRRRLAADVNLYFGALHDASEGARYDRVWRG